MGEGEWEWVKGEDGETRGCKLEMRRDEKKKNNKR